MPKKSFNVRQQLQEQARMLFYNKRLTNLEIAEILTCSVRTVIRWKKQIENTQKDRSPKVKLPRKRPRKFDPAIYSRIKEIKEKNSLYTAALIHRLIQEEVKTKCPTESSIRKYLISEGFHFKKILNRQGYIKFQREKPNDLWQIDIAGGQMIKGLGSVFLVLILDDCSRYVVGAQYFQDQKEMTVIQVIRDALVKYGRPNQILADNGTQFKNTMGEKNTRYLNLMFSLGVDAIFSRKNHPQSKGKVERIFGTIIQDFLLKIRAEITQGSSFSLQEFNLRFWEWIKWYNEQKPHRSLPHRTHPSTIYFNTSNRIFRPLETQIDWNQWINAYEKRKVSKYNEISYRKHSISIPPGYVGCEVDLLHLNDRFEIYHNNQILCTSMKKPGEYSPSISPIIRTIAQNGTFQYQSHWYSVDYKLAGKKVEIQEGDEGRTLFVYLDSHLIKSLSVK
jgi:transposase InsO family protein